MTPQSAAENQLIKTIFLIFVSFLAYYLSARLGLEMATINKQASPVWPATGIAMSLFLFFGPRAAIGVFLGAFISNFETGLNIPAALAIAVGNTMEAAFFAYALPRINTVRTFDIHSQAILGVFLFIGSASISATIGTASLWLTSVIPAGIIITNWLTWWIGDFLGALFIIPIAFRIKISNLDTGNLNLFQRFKLAALALVVLFLCYFIFNSETGMPYLFLIFFSIIFTAYWFNSIWVYLFSFVISVFAVWQTLLGHGPFSGS